MIDFDSYRQELAEKGYLSPYVIQFLFEDDPRLDKDRLLEALLKRGPNVEAIEEESGAIGFAHLIHQGQQSVQAVLSVPEACEKPTDTFSASLIQTWDWQEAEQIVSKVKQCITITMSFPDSLNRKDRIELVHRTVLSALDVLNPLAIHWLPSQRIVNPARYIDDLAHGGQLFSSAVNVRMFKIENSDERVMDTIGLSAFGLPDLQCHFAGLDPRQVTVYLYELSDYVFRHGDVFRDDDTIDGLQPGDKWKIRKENAYVSPTRRVIDLWPGQNAPEPTQN
jgi:hypothetical protein